MLNRRDCALIAAGASIAIVAAAVPRARRALHSFLVPAPPTRTLIVSADVLRKFVTSVLEKMGVDNAAAQTAADVLVLADLRGIDSHGVARLHAYCVMLRDGTMNPRPNVRVVRETASTATIDGDGGLGLIVAPRAMAIAMDKAAASGSGWVSVKNSNRTAAQTMD